MATSGSSVAVLNQYAQQHGLSLEWEDVSRTGPSHQSTFVVRLTLGDRATEGQGTSKKLARADAAKNMMEKLHGEGYLESVSAQDQRSPISILQERCQKNNKQLPMYSEISRVGPSNDPTFTFSVTIYHPETGEIMTAKGEGRSKDRAKTKAASAMLELLSAKARQSSNASDWTAEHHFTAMTRGTGDQYMHMQLGTRPVIEESSRLSRTGPSLISRGGSTEVNAEPPVPKPRTRAPANTAAVVGQDVYTSSSSPMSPFQGSVQPYGGGDGMQYTVAATTQSMQNPTLPAHPLHTGYGAQEFFHSQSQAVSAAHAGLQLDGTALLPGIVNPNSRLPDVCTSTSTSTPPPARRDPAYPLQSTMDQTKESMLSDLVNLPDLPSFDAPPDPIIAVQSTESSSASPSTVGRPIPKPRTKSVTSAMSLKETKTEDVHTILAGAGQSEHAAKDVRTIPPTQNVPSATQTPQFQTVHVAQADTAPHISDIPDTGGRPLRFVKQYTAHLGSLKTVPLEGKDQNDRYVCFVSLSQMNSSRGTMTALGAGTTEQEAEDDAARCLWRQLTGQGEIVR